MKSSFQFWSLNRTDITLIVCLTFLNKWTSHLSFLKTLTFLSNFSDLLVLALYRSQLANNSNTLTGFKEWSISNVLDYVQTNSLKPYTTICYLSNRSHLLQAISYLHTTISLYPLQYKFPIPNTSKTSLPRWLRPCLNEVILQGAPRITG